jgi:2-polyprenyl-3-methyl-5-hydroxy-6-metoxy-1,4-benzoquinol methylase
MLDMHYGREETAIGYDQPSEHIAEWNSMKRDTVESQAWPEAVDRIKGFLGETESPSIFDVGANDASFLDVARRAGFDPHGNELSSGAIELAKSKYGIDLVKGDLSLIGQQGRHDAVTMWCVLAHVPGTDQLLTEVRDLLRPGGVLFMQTPRWTRLDSAALVALEASGGRVSRVVDRRTPGHHLVFHTVRSMTSQLERLGYEVLEVRPRARFSLSTERYLRSLGIGAGVRKVVVPPLEALLSRELFFRIVLDVYARKRGETVAAPAEVAERTA